MVVFCVMKQSYKNHVRYYPLHHFIFYPALLIAIITAIRFSVNRPSQQPEWIAVTVVLIFIGWLSFMLRQHYALNNQNRIVRLEMRFRYYVLTGQRFELKEPQLAFNQIAALRFASDEELPALVERAVQEHLSSTDIKKSIVHWLPDDMRV